MNLLHRLIAITSVLIIGMAQAPANETSVKWRHFSQKIVGLWDVEVALFNCANGTPMGSFKAMHQYHLGGTGQVVPNSDPTPARLSAHMSIWEHIKQDDYQMTLKMYRFTEDGTYEGWVVIKNEISIDKAGNDYAGTGVAEFFKADGQYQFSSCPTLVGTRFNG